MIEILSRTTGTASMELIFGHTAIDLGSIFSQPCMAMQSEYTAYKFVIPRDSVCRALRCPIGTAIFPSFLLLQGEHSL